MFLLKRPVLPVSAAVVLFILSACGRGPENRLADAIRSGDEAATLKLIAAGVDPDARLGLDGTPLMLAANYGRARTVRALLAAGADVDASDLLGQTALRWAAASGHAGVAEILITAGAEIDVRDASGMTPWDWALQAGHREVIELLRERGAFSYRYRLIDAVAEGDVEAVKDSLARGADPDALVDRGNFHGGSVLSLAIVLDHREIVSLLLKAGAGVNDPFQRRRHRGMTALMWAARRGDLALARRLIAAGADVNAATPEGITPLFLAARSAPEEIVAELLSAGADPDVAVISGRDAGGTPLSVAREEGREAVAELLRSAGAE